jgi:hypothetical protein
MCAESAVTYILRELLMLQCACERVKFHVATDEAAQAQRRQMVKSFQHILQAHLPGGHGDKQRADNIKKLLQHTGRIAAKRHMAFIRVRPMWFELSTSE